MSNLETDERGVRTLYRNLLIAWNERNAAAMAACFSENGSVVGFDGSQVDSRVSIEQHLQPIFADHPTAAYVARVREVRRLDGHSALLRAVAGMIPPSTGEISPAVNTIHTLVAVLDTSGWRAALFQSTPAAFHGRPNDVLALTDELRAVAKRGVVCD